MISAKVRPLVNKEFDGFSLMEISIVLLIIGILATGILKGRDLIEMAQVRAIVNDFQHLQTVFESYVNSYDALPGDDATASKKFQSASDGDGDGEISDSDAEKIFEHLFSAGFIDSKDFKTPKIGGKYDIVAEDGVVYLRISNGGKAFLSKKQTLAILAKVNETFGANDPIATTDPKISEKSSQNYIVKLRIR